MNPLQAAGVFQGILNAYGTLYGSRAESAQYMGAAAAEQYNAAVSRQRSEVSRVIYGQREEQFRRVSRSELARQSAVAAEAGLGGNPDLERQNAVLAELDALNIRYEGELESYGYESQARLSDFNARNLRRTGRTVEKAGYIGAAGDLLGGYGNYLAGAA